jgi:hypothetical protein
VLLHYEIRVAGPVCPRLRELLTGLDLTTRGSSTRIAGELDQAGLHGVLERLRAFDCEIVSVRRGWRRPGPVAHGRGYEATSTYEIRLAGSLGRAGAHAFGDVLLYTEPALTVLTGEFSRASLHEVLDRVRALGLELVDIQQLRLAPGADG